MTASTRTSRPGRFRPAFGAAALLLLAAAVCLPSSASAAAPRWQLSTTAVPTVLEPGTEAQLAVSATNLGDAPAQTFSQPVTVTDRLPAGLTATAVEPYPLTDVGYLTFFGELHCTIPDPHTVSCGVEPTAAPLPPFEKIELHIDVQVAAAPIAGEVNEATISGGGAPAAGARAVLRHGSATPYEVEGFRLAPETETGEFAAQAGSHPFQFTGTFDLNQVLKESKHYVGRLFPETPEMTRNVTVELPPGLIGNPTVTPRCSDLQFATERTGHTNLCPPSTVLGVSSVTVAEPFNLGFSILAVPLFNLNPTPGEPARFGFEALGVPVILDTSVRSSGPHPDYGIDVKVRNVSQTASFISSRVTFWGVPGDTRHDNARGWSCLGYWRAEAGLLGLPPCEPSTQQPRPFLTMPTSCSGPLHGFGSAESWIGTAPPPSDYTFQNTDGEPRGISGCNKVPFSPTIHAEPTSDAATSPTGLNFDLNVADEGLNAAEGTAQSAIKRAVVTLPEGFTTNPSVAEGLHACSLGAYESETVNSEPGTGCPEDSKIGDVSVQTPLLEHPVTGSLFVAKQGENPFPNPSLLALYMVLKDPITGTLVKAAGKVESNPVTGQLTTSFDNLPQFPVSHFRLSFRQGQRAPLITPPTCGNYTVKADLYPYSNPTVPLPEASSFAITTGPEGQPCPNGTPPFHPNLEAGTLNNAAGTYSPFVAKITRRDSEQEITHFSIKLPPGVVGKLAGIPFCSEAGIAAAEGREHEGGGEEELQSPSCPAASEVGHTLVGTGVGNVLAYAPGKLYLAGPYNGAPISIVSITAAKVGPFDLGTVVVREALKVNPETAEVFVDATGSDPIPHIVDGVPVHLRDIRIYVNRPEFTLNPTSCERTSTASTVLSSGLNFASEADDQPVTVTSPFQAADCASLGFKPTLKLRLRGGTRRGAFPALRAELTQRPGEAAISRARVTLPHSEFLEQGHIGTVCTRVQFAAGAGNGTSCPAASVYGRAKAITPLLSEPLEGPVFLRSNPEHELPDLVAALHGQEINIDLVGHVEGVKGGMIRNTFETVPDAPVKKFVLEMGGGKKSLLVNSTDICQGIHRAAVDFHAHNGKLRDFRPALKAKCGKGHKHKGKRHRRRARR